MVNKKSKHEINDIDVAERKYLKSSSYKLTKIIVLIFSISFFIVINLILNNKKLSKFLFFNRSFNENKDERVLGHYPYKEISNDDLIEIEANILVHKDMYKPLLKMKVDAEKEGIYLVFLSGYRSIKLQKQIFYSLKSIRNQIATERARVSAPPGYSEHSTGFAIDIGDANQRETDFEESFENTNAFKWLKRNAAKYHFKLSFDREQTSVDYEPWHWRYEGSIEALKIFESSNRKSF